MQKAKKYDWKDSNMAMFGSDTEKKVKKESAATEPAWQSAGSKVGVKIWRIVKFEVTEWPKEEYGKFYSGDSYIVLNTYTENDSDALLYDVHFWIGKYSTQDEYGTAAYKTVELDTFLDDKPIQHREVQGHESELFKSYFPSITILKGGADTGFRRVLPEEYKPRLFHVSGTRKQIAVKEIPMKKACITDDDVFLMDLGLTIYQYNGANANKDEKFKAVQYLQELKSARGGKAKVDTLDADSTSPEHPFFTNLSDKERSSPKEDKSTSPQKLFRVSDADGSLDMDEVKVGDITLGDLNPQDVFVVDLVKHLFVWIGSGANVDERKNAMAYAHTYLQKTDHPFIPVQIVKEGEVATQRITSAMAA